MLEHDLRDSLLRGIVLIVFQRNPHDDPNHKTITLQIDTSHLSQTHDPLGEGSRIIDISLGL